MKKKSIEEKVLAGTARGDRDGQFQIQDVEDALLMEALEMEDGHNGQDVAPVKISIPRPALKLNDTARKWYYEIVNNLVEVDAFKRPDALLVALFCKNLDLLLDVCEKLDTAEDCIQTFANKTGNISAYFTAYNKLSANVIALAPQIGVGIKAREQITQFINNQLTLNLPGDEWSGIRKLIEKRR